MMVYNNCHSRGLAMAVRSTRIFSALADQFHRSHSLFLDSLLSMEAIHSACQSLG